MNSSRQRTLGKTHRLSRQVPQRKVSLTFLFDCKLIKHNNNGTQKKMHFIQRKQFNEINVTSPAFQQSSYLKIFPELIPRATENAVAGHKWPNYFLKLVVIWNFLTISVFLTIQTFCTCTVASPFTKSSTFDSLLYRWRNLLMWWFLD